MSIPSFPQVEKYFLITNTYLSLCLNKIEVSVITIGDSPNIDITPFIPTKFYYTTISPFNNYEYFQKIKTNKVFKKGETHIF